LASGLESFPLLELQLQESKSQKGYFFVNSWRRGCRIAILSLDVFFELIGRLLWEI
jgi:hypothetical protein